MTKKMVREMTHEYVDFYGDSLVYLKKQVDNWIESYGEQAYIESYEDYGGKSWGLFIEREETDEEYQERLEKDKEHKEYRKKQYEKLKKEFENEN